MDIMSKLGVMVCGHGSRDVGAVTEFNQLVANIAGRLPEMPVESGFLEFAHPVIRDGLDKLLTFSRFLACCLPRATSRTMCHQS